MQTAKTLIRLSGCLGWSESSLGAQVILLVLPWGGSVYIQRSSRTLFQPCHEGNQWCVDSNISNTQVQPISGTRSLAFRLKLIYFIDCECRKGRLWQECTDLPEPSLFPYVVSTLFAWTSTFSLFLWNFISTKLVFWWLIVLVGDSYIRKWYVRATKGLEMDGLGSGPSLKGILELRITKKCSEWPLTEKTGYAGIKNNKETCLF